MSRSWGLVVCATGATIVAVGALSWHYAWRRRSRGYYVTVDPPPHPDWELGQKQESPYKDFKTVMLDPETLPVSEVYPLIISSVVPRPIAFVSSRSVEGVDNLAPFSYFGAAAQDPPHIVVSVGRSQPRGGQPKDTAQNIMDTKEFVVNIISEWFVESANYTCSPFESQISEFEITHLTPVPSVKVKPPRVEESAAQMECRLKHHYDIINKSGAVHSTVFIGEVVMFHVNEGVMMKTPTGKAAVDLAKLQPICRLGGTRYARVTSVFDLPRPTRTV